VVGVIDPESRSREADLSNLKCQTTATIITSRAHVGKTTAGIMMFLLVPPLLPLLFGTCKGKDDWVKEAEGGDA